MHYVSVRKSKVRPRIHKASDNHEDLALEGGLKGYHGGPEYIGAK